MTSNRMGLTSLEEIYLGHILRGALECAVDTDPGLLPSFTGCSAMEGDLAALAEESLARWALSPRVPQEDENEL